MEVEEEEDSTTHKLLALWVGKEKDWLTYKQIVTGLKAYGISDRTVDRRLLTLVNQGKLIREVRGYKKTFYKPSDEFLHMLSSLSDWFRIHEQSLSRIGRDVMDKLAKVIEESNEISERISNQLEKELDNLPQSEKDTDECFEKAIFNALSKESLTEEENRTFFSLLDNLIKNTIYDCLFNPYVAGRIADPENLASILDDDVRSIVESYMDVWAFLYKHPGALFELKKYLQNVIPKENSERSAL